MNLDRSWVFSPSSRTRKFHSPAIDRSTGAISRSMNCYRTRCGQYLVRIVVTRDVPEDLGICDECVLIDWMQPSVYRFYDAHGALLYVGCTDNVLRRFLDHSRPSSPSKAWWPQQVRHTITTYPTKAEAYWAEDAAIDTEKPLYPQPRTDSAEQLVSV